MSRRLLALTVALLSLPLASARADEAADELKKMQGVWEVVEVWAEGKQVPEEAVKARGLIVEFKDAVAIRRRSEGPERKMKVALHPKEMPKGIDFTADSDGNPDKSMGIYEWTKDGKLRLCVSDHGETKERPKEFVSEKNWIIMTLKKAEKKADKE